MSDRVPAGKQPTTVLAGPYGHPLHPALVAVPIGAWTASVLLDLASLVIDDAATASHAAWWLLGLGVVGAAAAASVGFLDLVGIPAGTKAKRVALTHMTVNLTATALFAVAWLVRRPDVAPPDGTATGHLVLSILAFAVLSVGGYLGGELAYRYGVRVADERTQAEGFAGARTVAGPRGDSTSA
jgi:uncharacterized membrane protein